MNDLLIALGFAAVILCPCIIAAVCASQPRLIRPKTHNRCPIVDRRDRH